MFHSVTIFSNRSQHNNKLKKMNMKNKLNIIKNWLPIFTLVVLVSASCTKNENVPEATPINYPQGSGSTIGEVLNNPNFSILKAAVTKAGLMPAVSDKNSLFTVFAPDDAAFIRSGVPLAAINALPAAAVASIVQYHIIPGRSITSAGIPSTFPNVQMPTAFIIPAPNTNPLVRFTNFPSKRGSNVWVNNIPVVTPD
jgi:uncharacterized surface protein with fasciclin (FAS1) repeats